MQASWVMFDIDFYFSPQVGLAVHRHSLLFFRFTSAAFIGSVTYNDRCLQVQDFIRLCTVSEGTFRHRWLEQVGRSWRMQGC